MQARANVASDVKSTPNPRLEMVYKLLKDEKYNEAADILKYKTTQPPTAPTTSYGISYIQSLFIDTTTNHEPKPFTPNEIGQVVQWMANNKINFAKIFLQTSLGSVLAQGTFDDHQSPIFSALETHVKFFEIIRHAEFPKAQLGNLLQQYVEKHDYDKVVQLLKYTAAPMYEDTSGHELSDSDKFNDKHGDFLVRYCHPTTGNRALHLACMDEKNDDKLIHVLIEHGAFLTDRNINKITPLDLLLEKNKDALAFQQFLTAHFGVLSQHHICKLILAFCIKKRLDLAKHLIQLADASNCDLDLFYTDEKTGNSILHFAAEQKEDLEFTELVLRHTDKLSFDKENKNKLTPLMLAIENNNDKAVKLFIDLAIQRKTHKSNDMIWTTATNESAVNTQGMDPTYDYSSEQLGKAFLLLVKTNKLDLAIELFEKRPDTKIDVLDPETNNTIAHFAALATHPQKENLFLLLCKNNIDLEQGNRSGVNALSILIDRKEYSILTSVFKNFKTIFTLDTLQKTAECIILGKNDLQYLPDYLLQIQSHPSKDPAIKQEITKRLLMTLIKQAQSEDEVKKIISLLDHIAKDIPYFYHSPTLFNTPSTCSSELDTFALRKIISYSVLKNSELINHPRDEKAVELQPMGVGLKRS
jgi:ankyrin repeat protein